MYYHRDYKEMDSKSDTCFSFKNFVLIFCEISKNLEAARKSRIDSTMFVFCNGSKKEREITNKIPNTQGIDVMTF